MRVAYTGTHDNSTAKGWFKSVPKEAQDYFLAYAVKPKKRLRMP
jgi:4-alpha-glucanotransferase